MSREASLSIYAVRMTEWMEKKGVFSGLESLLVGFSGGADSSALLHLMREVCLQRGIALAAVHVDHGIRGAEAARDREFCSEECDKLGIKLFVCREDVPARAKDWGMSLEEAARKVRYDCFEKLMDEQGFSRTATAHHATDNAETLLFNLLRGSSSDGMGIPPVRDRYIRPLLAFRREELLAYCTENGIPFVNDSTNSDTAYTRNYIRQVLLPACERINPEAIDALTRFSELSRRDSAFLAAEAEKIPDDASPERLAALPDPLLSRYLRRLCEHQAPDTRLDFRHTEEIMALIRSRGFSHSLSLPGNCSFVLERDRILFRKADEAPSSCTFEYLLHEGVNHIPETGCAVLLDTHSRPRTDVEKDINDLKNIYRLFIHKSVDSVKISKAILIRTRREGDTVRIGGMTRKIRKLYQSKRMPSSKTVGLPFFCNMDDDCRIFWIPGFDIADGYEAAGSSVMDLYYFY